MSFVESEERIALRKAVSEFGAQYGHDYFVARSRAGEKT